MGATEGFVKHTLAEANAGFVKHPLAERALVLYTLFSLL